MPAVAGGWRKGENRPRLRLTDAVVEAHLTGEVHIGLRGRMDLAGHDRLFPSQDVLPTGGVGNLIAAPLHGRSPSDGATLFLDLGTLEPYEDQWAYLSSLHRLSPREVERLAARVGPVRVGTAIAGLQQQTCPAQPPDCSPG